MEYVVILMSVIGVVSAMLLICNGLVTIGEFLIWRKTGKRLSHFISGK